MAFQSILDLRESPWKDSPRNVFFTDLNLDQVIRAITIPWKEDIEPFYYYFPADEACERYRRDVYADIASPQTSDAVLSFVENLRTWQMAADNQEELSDPMQKAVWFLLEAGYFCDALQDFHKALSGCKLQSEGMLSFQSYLEQYLQGETFRNMAASMQTLRAKLCNMRVRLVYDKDCFILDMDDAGQEGETASYQTFLKERFGDTGRQWLSPFHAQPELNELEQKICGLLIKKDPAFFKEIKNFQKTYHAYDKDCFLRFQKEVLFYLSFLQFAECLTKQGGYVTLPHADSACPMQADGLYDIALACVNFREEKEVVSNDFSFAKGEQFFVLTGPNQGGKTTFARSLGQLVYFAKMGLPVPARYANVPYYSTILTHFSVEESPETGRGKLKEELGRLKPMMEQNADGAFVVINELFTTAANYDACIMGKKVLDYFIARGCIGIYVTHLTELAKAHEKVVSLRAMVDEHQVRTFRVLRGDATELAYADSQVNKYALRYDQIKERMQAKQPLADTKS